MNDPCDLQHGIQATKKNLMWQAARNLPDKIQSVSDDHYTRRS
jgi:hypothetical protein